MKNSRKNGWKTFGNIVLALVWVGASIIVSQLLVGYLLLFIVGEEKLMQPVWLTVYSALAYTMAMLLIVLAPLKLKKLHQKRRQQPIKTENTRELLGLKGLPTWADTGLAPVGFLTYLLLAAGLVAVFSFFPWFDAEQAQNVGFNFLGSSLDRIVAFLILVVVAPIAEEIIFRGWLYGKLRYKLLTKFSNRTSMAIAIILVSLLFGLMHGQWNVGVNVFAMSVVLCGLREITGTIYAGILLHMIKNGLAFYLLYVLGVS